MLPQLVKLKGAALDLFFPQKCLGCEREGELLCAACRKALPRIVNPICPKCGRPQSSEIMCPGCTGWQASIDGIRSPLRFTGIVREAIHQLKYKNIRSLAEPLAAILTDYLIQNKIPAQILVPVPLHPKRLRERGYNQSSLLARKVGKWVNLPVKEDCLTRTKFITPQAKTQSVDERRRNVLNAFTCFNANMQNTQVLLIDDVSTSGATLNSCAQALKGAGASTVWALTLAREI